MTLTERLQMHQKELDISEALITRFIDDCKEWKLTYGIERLDDRYAWESD